MGRRKRQYKNKRQNNHGGRGSTELSNINGSTTAGTCFTDREKQRLRQYLEDYQRLKIQQSNLDENNQESAAITTTTKTTSSLDSSEIKIAGIVFPELTTDEVLNRPFLALPSELAFRQRQYVHDCCKERKYC